MTPRFPIVGPSAIDASRDLIRRFEKETGELDQDSASTDKSIGVVHAPPGENPAGIVGDYVPNRGSEDQIVDTCGGFAEKGCARLELTAAGDEDRTI